MPMLETVEEFAESIADMVGIYGVPIDEYGDGIDDHEDDCKCRMCFVSEMMDRIRESVKNEALLKNRTSVNSKKLTFLKRVKGIITYVLRG